MRLPATQGGMTVYNDREYQGSVAAGSTSRGRWPANVVLSHSPECVLKGEKKVSGTSKPKVPGGDTRFDEDKNYRFKSGEAGYGDVDGKETVQDWDCVEDCAVRMLDEQSGPNCGAAAPAEGPTLRKGTKKTAMGAFNGTDAEQAFYGDKGGSSRFFYQAKAPNSEKWFFCDVCNDAFPHKQTDEHKHDLPSTDHLVRHPTPKSVGLMSWLVRLITPPGGVVLDPFMGTASTGVAALRQGFRFVGMERDRKYFIIAKRRLQQEKP